VTAVCEWIPCNPEGTCESCGQPVLLLGFKLQFDVNIGNGERCKMEADPPTFLCSACFDAIS